MLAQSKLESLLVSNITDPEILERYTAQDPLVVQQIRTIAAYLSLLSQEIDIASLEPFIKTRDRSIIADATNKGILPLGTASRHILQVINNGAKPVTLGQGREVEDSAGGRIWRLMQSITIEPEETGEVAVEQSEYREIEYTPSYTEAFHRFAIHLTDDLFMCGISVLDIQTNPATAYSYVPRWMNVAIGDKAFNLTTDEMRRAFIQFGDSDRAGVTATPQSTFRIGITETHGEVDTTRLKDASLVDVYTTEEQKVVVKFKTGGLVRKGSDPLTVSQLKILSSYPSLYDESAVYLGNFDYLVRQKFMNRAHFISVWNENIQQKHYGVTWQDINRLNIAVQAIEESEQENLEDEITQLIGRADSLYLDRVNKRTVDGVEYVLNITGRLASIHNVEAVKAQIRSLLVAEYGKGSLNASRWLVNGFNGQEISNLIRTKIPAFQDRISDFSILPSTRVYKPHEWVYMTNDSINVTLERTAENMGASWTL